MAKMKVHELAKELDKKSKELIDFLQAKGYDVKVAQSSIEDEAIALVRTAFGSGKDAAAPQKEAVSGKETAAEEKKEAKDSGEKTAANAAKPKAEKAPEAPKSESARTEGKPESKTDAPKKKRIIFVSNPHNSKMGGRPAQGGGQSRGGNRAMSNGARPVQPQNAPHKIIRPTQKPIPVTAEPYEVRQRQQEERRLEQRQQEKRDNARNEAAVTKPAAG